jgi:hypothetical protein
MAELGGTDAVGLVHLGLHAATIRCIALAFLNRAAHLDHSDQALGDVLAELLTEGHDHLVVHCQRRMRLEPQPGAPTALRLRGLGQSRWAVGPRAVLMRHGASGLMRGMDGRQAGHDALGGCGADRGTARRRTVRKLANTAADAPVRLAGLCSADRIAELSPALR